MLNKDQISYQIGRAAMNEIGLLPIIPLFGYCFTKLSINFLLNPTLAELPSLWFGGNICGLGLWMGYELGLRPFLKYRKSSKIARSNPKIYPLEVSDKIIIEDKEGLENLLDKTAEKRWREWGTYLKSYPDKNRAIIYEIPGFDKLREEGIVNYGTFFSFTPKLTKSEMTQAGYNGIHHYHPYLKACSYHISRTDRLIFLNMINLLTFNLRSGPEIIGYNTLHTYIPADKTNKILIKASNKEIMKYLAQTKAI